MNNGESSILENSVRRVLVLQGGIMILVLLIVAATLFLTTGWDGAGVKLASSAYGSVLAITGTILSARSIRRASKGVGETEQIAMVPIYSGLLNKLVIVGGGIAFGLIIIGLDPVLVVTGNNIVQLSTAWTMLRPDNHGHK
jgi:hypothetical protein